MLIDDGEIRDHQWIRPAEALRRRDAGEVLIIPPTWITLNTLAHATSVDDVLVAHGVGRARGLRHPDGPASTGSWSRCGHGDAGYDDGDATKPGPRHRLLMGEDGWRFERST